MDISNPRRILAVSLPDDANQLSKVIQDLSGVAPRPASTSLAGTTHHAALETRYYKASVPVWLDLVASPAEWADSFLSAEAAEVLAVLGGLVVVFALPAAGGGGAHDDVDVRRLLLRHVGRVVMLGLGGWEWDGVRLAVGVGDADADDWDELCAEAGLEFVQIRSEQQQRQRGINDFGERTGMARVREALESNDWAQADSPAASDFGDFASASDDPPGAADDGAHLDSDSLDFGLDPADFEGLQKALWRAGRDDNDDDDAEAESSGPATTAGGGDACVEDADPPQGYDDADVLKLERAMRKLQAVRDAGAGVGEAQRKRMAARAVAEAMKDL